MLILNDLILEDPLNLGMLMPAAKLLIEVKRDEVERSLRVDEYHCGLSAGLFWLHRPIALLQPVAVARVVGQHDEKLPGKPFPWQQVRNVNTAAVALAALVI